MNFIIGLFEKFLKGNKTDEKSVLEFTEEQKSEIVKSALSTSSQVLISAMVLTNSHNFITGTVEMPDGTRFILTFKKEEKK